MLSIITSAASSFERGVSVHISSYRLIVRSAPANAKDWEKQDFSSLTSLSSQSFTICSSISLVSPLNSIRLGSSAQASIISCLFICSNKNSLSTWSLLKSQVALTSITPSGVTLRLIAYSSSPISDFLEWAIATYSLALWLIQSDSFL